MSFSADPLSRRDCTSMSKISPSLLTRSPQVYAAALDRDYHLIQVPAVRRSRPQSPQIAGECWSELGYLPPDDVELSLCREFLDGSVADREPEIEPGCVPNNLGRELVTGIGDGLHPHPIEGRMARQLSHDSAA